MINNSICIYCNSKSIYNTTDKCYVCPKCNAYTIKKRTTNQYGFCYGFTLASIFILSLGLNAFTEFKVKNDSDISLIIGVLLTYYLVKLYDYITGHKWKKDSKNYYEIKSRFSSIEFDSR